MVVAFSAICTHQGCKVAPAGTTLNCPCHGSKYDAMTGKVLNGPAKADLAPVAVKVSGQDVVAG
jgi:Rieske Fe-S protein